MEQFNEVAFTFNGTIAFMYWPLFPFLQILFFLYLFGGIAVMKYRGATGFELIPNFYFWVGLPGQIKVIFL